MANTLSVTGRTRLAWTLSENQSVGSLSKFAEIQSSRSISHGTGPNQATVAITDTVSVTGTSTTLIDLGAEGYRDRSFGYEGWLSFQTLKEAVVSVTTGPTGGYLTVGLPSGVTGVRLNVGAQMHIADYLAGLPGGGPIALKSNVTGTYSVDVTAIGIGSYSNLY